MTEHKVKPHISIKPKNHKWAVWHHRSAYPWQLPATHGDSPSDAYQRYYTYMELNRPTYPKGPQDCVRVVVSEGIFWVLEDNE